MKLWRRILVELEEKRMMMSRIRRNIGEMRTCLMEKRREWTI